LSATGEAPRSHVGRPVRRFEDGRFLRGQGNFMDDIVVPGALEVAFVRSPVAHALIGSIDTSRAAAVPGVTAVVTAEDLDHLVGPFVTDMERPELRACTRPQIARDKVRFVGEIVAAVVATSRYVAEDARELVEVDYEPLPPVVDAERAFDDDAPLIHDDIPGNSYAHIEWESGDVDGLFESAARVYSKRFHARRQSAAPLETRGVIARWDESASAMTVWNSTQMPHVAQVFLGMALGLPASQLRIIAPDIGGGFGNKSNVYTEEAIIPALARLLGRPVKWIEDRSESLSASSHAKELVVHIDIAVDEGGRFTAFRTHIVGDGGAYPSHPNTSLIDPLTAATLTPGLYDIQALRYSIDSAVTNKAPAHAYRGVGWSPGHTARELLVDEIARDLGIDPVDLRVRNMIPSEPFTNVTGMAYDGGSYQESLEKALEMAGYENFRERQAAARGEGRYIGIGVSPFVEPTAWGSAAAQRAGFPVEFYDSAQVTMEPDGTVILRSGTHNHGQGHETTLAQVAADQLGVQPEQVKLVSGDTESAVRGSGTYASRTAVIAGGGVIRAATDVRNQLFDLAAHLMEASPHDLEFGDGEVRVKGSPERSTPIATLAFLSYLGGAAALPEDFEPGLSSTRFYDPPETYSNGCAVAIVEVDRETGVVKIERIVAVEDCGVMLNPMIVEGQVAGAIAQGIGAALLEESVYDDGGQFVSATLMDFLYPSSTEVPPLEIAHIETPSTVSEGGIKGVGEGGTICTPAAILNAVADALSEDGVRVETSPLGPSDVLDLITRTSSEGAGS
jgi:carbon-monoxide dehydrogenase large subunit